MAIEMSTLKSLFIDKRLGLKKFIMFPASHTYINKERDLMKFKNNRFLFSYKQNQVDQTGLNRPKNDAKENILNIHNKEKNKKRELVVLRVHNNVLFIDNI